MPKTEETQGTWATAIARNDNPAARPLKISSRSAKPNRDGDSAEARTGSRHTAPDTNARCWWAGPALEPSVSSHGRLASAATSHRRLQSTTAGSAEPPSQPPPIKEVLR